MPVRRICLALAVVVATAALPAAASADSIVYIKDKQVWIAHADGSGARQFTQHAYGWASPSEADDGTVVVAGGLSRVNADGSDSDGSSEIYRFRPDGNQVGGPTPTWGSRSTPACPAYPPSRVRVSPDGTKIAYGIYGCGGGGYMTTLWTPAGSTGLNFPNQTIGQQDFWNPSWIDSTRFAISHMGPAAFGGAHWGEHYVGDGDNTGGGWYEPQMDDTTKFGVREADAVISRDGATAAVFFEDSYDYGDDVPRHVALWIYHNPGVPGHWTTAGYGDPVCQFDLDPASDFTPIEQLDPSLSPDGTKVLWGDKGGVELMSLGDVANGCAGSSDVVTLIPGGSQPFYAKGNLAPGAADPSQPGDTVPGTGGTGTPGGTGTSGGTGGDGGGGATAVLTPVAKFRIATKKAKLRAHKKIAFDARKSFETGGALVSYRWKFGDGKTGKGRSVTHKYRRRGTYTVTLTVLDATGRKAVVKHKVKIRR
jgi:hypothetical protein